MKAENGPDGLCKEIFGIPRKRCGNFDWDSGSISRKQKMDLQWYLGERTLE